MHDFFTNGFCGNSYLYSGHGFGGIFMIILIALLLVVLFLLLYKRGTFEGRGKEDSAMEHLKKRFANGEIDKEEYLEKKQVLEN